jgi:HSP20 family protein
MSLVRWNPSRDLAAWPSDLFTMQREMNRMFDGFFRGDLTEKASNLTSWIPAVDITEHEDGYVVKVDLPGVSKDDVRITFESNVLTIRGEKKQEKETNKENVHRIERAFGTFRRAFTLPTSVKYDRIDAVYKDGILAITLPKAEEARPRRIEVKVK